VLQTSLGDLLVADVGGATTDLHSVTEGSPEVQKMMLSPEPCAKRTVEGDLGVYVNRLRVMQMVGQEKMEKDLQMTHEQLAGILAEYRPVPNEAQIPVVEYLTSLCCGVALNRHCGRFITSFGPAGKTTIAEGKDLTNVRYFSEQGRFGSTPGRKEDLVGSVGLARSPVVVTQDTRTSSDRS
jgi:uncharacterized protein (TIGR01319 family)